MVHFDSGELEIARSHAQEALELSKKNNEMWVEGMSMLSLGRILWKDDPSTMDKALEKIEKGIEILEELKIRPWPPLGYLFIGELYAGAGQKDKARETLEKTLSMMNEMGMMYWPDRAREVLERLEIAQG